MLPGFSIEAGGIATRTRSDIRGDALLTNQGNSRNSAQLYSGYIGPNLASHIGPIFANAAYRFGYTKVEAAGATGVSTGPRLDSYDDSKVHVATASVGVKAGQVLPIGITASASYTREDAGQLDQRYEGKFGRVDAVLPIAGGFAVAGGVGYEKIKISQRDAVRDGANNPVVDANGRFVTDNASPRRIAYDIDGMFWDAGVIWKPSRRTFLEARAGKRYGSMSYTGSLSYQIGPGSGIQIGVYDSVQTFGQQLSGTLATLPTSFVTTTDPFGNQYGGCVYGTVGSATGGCLNNVFASAATSAYRSRGVTGVAVMGRGGTRIGLGGGYSRRTFIAPTGTPGFNVNGTSDESFYAQLFGSTGVGPNGSLSASAFGSYYTTDIAGADGVLGWGGPLNVSWAGARPAASLTYAWHVDDDGLTSTDGSALNVRISQPYGQASPIAVISGAARARGRVKLTVTDVWGASAHTYALIGESSVAVELGTMVTTVEEAVIVSVQSLTSIYASDQLAFEWDMSSTGRATWSHSASPAAVRVTGLALAERATVHVRVRDPRGSLATAATTVLRHTAPVAELRANLAPERNVSAYTGRPIVAALSASGSKDLDADGSVVAYVWTANYTAPSEPAAAALSRVPVPTNELARGALIASLLEPATPLPGAPSGSLSTSVEVYLTGVLPMGTFSVRVQAVDNNGAHSEPREFTLQADAQGRVVAANVAGGAKDAWPPNRLAALLVPLAVLVLVGALAVVVKIMRRRSTAAREGTTTEPTIDPLPTVPLPEPRVVCVTNSDTDLHIQAEGAQEPSTGAPKQALEVV
ncbi:hypothetical protein EON62_00810 [archaeon]|nr:MAG: hypothetical protein EON62_00810 [archaeon]